MRSVPVAMTWEILSGGRWSLLTFALGANVMPLFLLSALRFDGGVDPMDPSMLTMHLVLVQMNMFIFGMAMMDTPGQPARLFALPISTSAIVGWQMLLGMVLMALETLASTACLNAMFGLGWPLWGPALFAAAGVSGIQAALWTTDKSAWSPFAIVAVGIGFGLWLKSRFGPTFSMPTHLWIELTPVEVLMLLLVVGLSYFVAVVGVARRRCGELLPSLGIIAWIGRVFDPPAYNGSRFATPAEAQFWFEWRNKGWALPAIVVFGMTSGLIIWATSIRDRTQLFEALVGGGAMLSAIGFTGFLLGNFGNSDSAFEMGHFLATRPLNTTEMSRVFLKVLAKSVLLAWGIWAIPFVLFSAYLFANGEFPDVELLRNLGWWYFPVTLLGCWIVVSAFASVAMTGRTLFLVQIIFGVFAFSLGETMFSKYALPREARLPFERGVWLAIGVALALGTAWAFVAARRRGLIGSPTVAGALSVWGVLSGLISLDWVRHPARPLPLGVLAVCAAALVVAPLATAPLALAWNRNR